MYLINTGPHPVKRRVQPTACALSIYPRGGWRFMNGSLRSLCCKKISHFKEGGGVVGVMSGYYDFAALGIILLFSLFAHHKMKAIELELKLRIEVEAAKVKEHIQEIASSYEIQATEAIDELTDVDPFEAIDLMRQQMLTQVMGWGMNMVMQKFGGASAPELGVAEYENTEV